MRNSLYHHSKTFLCLACLLALLSTACKSTKQGTQLKLKNKSSRFLLKKLASHKIEAEWFSAKARITYKDDNETRKLNANIRMRKDSVIWMNIKKLGVEAARILITTDSVYVINRQAKTYTIRDFSHIDEELGLLIGDQTGQTAFQALQDLLLGNPIFIPVENFEAGIDDQRYTLRGNYNGISNEYQLNGSNYLLANMMFQEQYPNRTVDFQYDDYNDLGKYENFSYFRTLNLSSEELPTITLKIKLTSVELNTPKSIRFEIQSRYKRVD